ATWRLCSALAGLADVSESSSPSLTNRQHHEMSREVRFIVMLRLPEDEMARQWLYGLGVSAQDCADTLATRPDPHHDCERWGHLERCHDALMSEMGTGLPASGYQDLPALPTESGPAGMHLYVWLY